MKRSLLLLFIIACGSAQAQGPSPIRGLRIEGSLSAHIPVALRTSHPITVSYDLTTTDVQDLHIRVWHCDRNWKRTESVFLNDRFRTMSYGPFPSTPAPLDVQGYRTAVRFQLPGVSGLEQFTFSGNYELELWNAKESQVLGTARFLVAEALSPNALRIDNRFLPMTAAPADQVLRISIPFRVPAPSPEDDMPIALTSVRIADVYRNREFGRPFRIDLDDQDPETFIDGYGTPSLKFVASNIPAGNEYRSTDVRDVRRYPAGQVMRSLDGADVARSFAKGLRDRDGGYALVTEGRDADYVRMRFEILRPEDAGNEDIRVVGVFNDWNPTEAWKLQRVNDQNRYAIEVDLRRGSYDYQYVLGGSDWQALEGNDWRTKSTFTAVIYYNDPRMGGYDRILSVSQGQSPGGTEETVR